MDSHPDKHHRPPNERIDLIKSGDGYLNVGHGGNTTPPQDLSPLGKLRSHMTKSDSNIALSSLNNFIQKHTPKKMTSSQLVSLFYSNIYIYI